MLIFQLASEQLPSTKMTTLIDQIDRVDSGTFFGLSALTTSSCYFQFVFVSLFWAIGTAV